MDEIGEELAAENGLGIELPANVRLEGGDEEEDGEDDVAAARHAREIDVGLQLLQGGTRLYQ